MKLSVFFFTYIENCAFLFLLKFCLPKISELNLYLNFSKPMETYGFYIYLVNVSLFLKSGPKFFFILPVFSFLTLCFYVSHHKLFVENGGMNDSCVKHKETIYFYCIASLSLFFFPRPNVCEEQQLTVVGLPHPCVQAFTHTVKF